MYNNRIGLCDYNGTQKLNGTHVINGTRVNLGKCVRKDNLDDDDDDLKTEFTEPYHIISRNVTIFTIFRPLVGIYEGKYNCFAAPQFLLTFIFMFYVMQRYKC